METQVSAFDVYRKQSKTSDAKKRKLELLKQHVSSKKLKTLKLDEKDARQNVAVNGTSPKKGKKPKLVHVQQANKEETPLLVSKLNGMSSKKGKKPKLAHVEQEDKEESPLLVPKLNATSPKKGKKKKKVVNIRRESREESPPLLVPIRPKQRKVSGENLFNPVASSLAIFKWLIYPVKPKDFFPNFWEKDVMHIERNDEDYYKDILTTDRLDDILREFPLHYTRNVDVVSYENGIKEVLNQEGRAVPSALWDFYVNGCSIRVLNPQTYDGNVHNLISALQEYFGTMVGTNVYLTPPGSQGFAPHFDDIEAFVVQLEGRKHWKLYKPRDQDVLARDSSPNFKSEDLGDPFMEVTLNAGDILYFPRGTIHEGRTDSDAHSLHITVSVYQHTAYVDLLEHLVPVALKKAANDNVEFRRGLPLNYLKHVGHVNKTVTSKKRVQILTKVKELMQSLIDYIDVDLAADQLGRKFMHDAMPPMCERQEAAHTSRYDGDYMRNGRVFNRVEIGLDTKVRLLRYHSIRLVAEPGVTPKLFYCTENAKVYHGEDEQWVEVEESFLPVVETLQRTYPEFVEVEKLPLDDEAAKIQLVSDLWERGVLVTDGPLPSVPFEDDDELSSSDDDTQ